MAISVPESHMTDHPMGDWAVLRFRGADAAGFLQGQLSNDLSLLQAGSILRTGLHNPQGRTTALLWLAAGADGDILALLPQELAAATLAQLRRFVLRAKLTISDESAQHRVLGLKLPVPSAPVAQSPAPAGLQRFDADRALVVLPVSATEFAPPNLLTRAQWRALDVAAGMPQVYQATTGQFVAQMLNLDCIEAVSFTKGCYTGQEVIARAHYRGRVKRRMQRFETVSAAQLAPGDSGQLEDGRGFRVVEAITRPDGSCEFLAVAPLAAGTREDGAESAADSGHALAVRALPLPYELPE